MINLDQLNSITRPEGWSDWVIGSDNEIYTVYKQALAVNSKRINYRMADPGPRLVCKDGLGAEERLPSGFDDCLLYLTEGWLPIRTVPLGTDVFAHRLGHVFPVRLYPDDLARPGYTHWRYINAPSTVKLLRA